MVYLLFASSHVWIGVRATVVSFSLEQPTPKVELLGVLLVQVVICFIILEGEALQEASQLSHIMIKETLQVHFPNTRPSAIASGSHWCRLPWVCEVGDLGCDGSCNATLVR